MSTTADRPTSAKPEVYNPTTAIARQVKTLVDKGSLILPGDYSAENALKSAWLTLQTIQDRDGKPALQVCTQESIANALFDMVVQGLNPAKKQGYFIVYGKSLTWQRSYFGDQALAERVSPGIEIYYSVIWEGDEFQYETIRGRTVVIRHLQKLEHQGKKIIGAYCGIYNQQTGEDMGAEVMTFAQIQKSWGMSKTYQPSGNKGTHHDFPDQMSLRTVIRRRCKPIINASSDAVLLASVRRQDEQAALNEVNEESELKANQEVLTIPQDPVAQIPDEPTNEPVQTSLTDQPDF